MGMRHGAGRLALAAVAAMAAAAGWAQGAVEVVPIALARSNAFLVRGQRPVLVDTGLKSDLPALEAALAARGVGWRDLAAVVLTHAHADHAGLAREVAERGGGVPIIMGALDAPMARAGRHDSAALVPTSTFARLLQLFAMDPTYPPFEPTVRVDAEIDLRPYGLAARAVPAPGHTPGSIAVVLDDGRALAGDLMMGGWLGGALWPGRADEHYFYGDRARNRASVAALLARPVHLFYLGHGGPVTRESVAEALGIALPAR